MSALVPPPHGSTSIGLRILCAFMHARRATAADFATDPLVLSADHALSYKLFSLEAE
jgi:hypothetical protein